MNHWLDSSYMAIAAKHVDNGRLYRRKFNSRKRMSGTRWLPVGRIGERYE